MPAERVADLYCSASERVEAALAKPAALIVYAVVRLAMTWTMPSAIVTVALSDFANVMLILIAAAQYRKGRTMEREVDAVAEALPGVDHEGIRAEARA